VTDSLEIFNLKGKTVLVTGAAGLIGSEACRAFYSAGAIVAAADVLSPEEIELAIDVSAFEESTSEAFRVDVTDRDSVVELVSSVVNKFGAIDVLVHLAAIDAKFDDESPDGAMDRFENFPRELWSKSVEVNFTGTFNVTQIVCKQMLQQGFGNVILTASTYSLVAPNNDLYRAAGAPEMVKPVDYVATKSFIPNFTRYLATHYAGAGIRANCIVPHGVENENPQWFKDNFAKMSPLRRMASVSELSGPLIFLASDASSYMTGSSLVVDGGWTAW
jgi:NAD(P)-dependent dehydrogenase (short-subunit alcohol dehydrogenase family)